MITAEGSGCPGIAAGVNGKGIYADNNAVIFASGSPAIKGYAEQSHWKGVIFENGNGRVYGNVTPTVDFEIPESRTIDFPEGSVLTLPANTYLPDDITLTGSGTLFPEEKRLTSEATITGDPSMTWTERQSASLDQSGYTHTGNGEAAVSWYADDNGAPGSKLDAAPSDAGTYWVQVETTATELYTSAEASKRRRPSARSATRCRCSRRRGARVRGACRRGDGGGHPRAQANPLGDVAGALEPGIGFEGASAVHLSLVPRAECTSDSSLNLSPSPRVPPSRTPCASQQIRGWLLFARTSTEGSATLCSPADKTAERAALRYSKGLPWQQHRP